MAADTWGLSWGGTTGSWLSRWASTFVPPTPPEAADVTPAGRKRRRLFVEIDDQTFEVRDVQHAQALLDRARELATRAAQEQAERVIPSTRKTGRKLVTLKTPTIRSPDAELKDVIQKARKEINAIYRTSALDTELALLLARRLAQEDEEEALLLLM